VSSSTTLSLLRTVYCYRVLEGGLTQQEARHACQRQRSILLEFDTRGEVRRRSCRAAARQVEDFQVLARDSHLALPAHVWTGAAYSPQGGFRCGAARRYNIH
jgi:hypothetical protein